MWRQPYGLAEEERKEKPRIFDLLVNNYGVPVRTRWPLTVRPKEWYVRILGKDRCFKTNVGIGVTGPFS
jgi:hypothetical protein